ncbi:MAG: primosomal protein N', partial [Clostridia bacterium]|nr:primosomal protein N' [Clostridia bacterium]
LRCPACRVSLTFPGGPAALLCHYCGRRERPPAVCPACGGRAIRYFGAGTERVVERVRAAFPQARVARLDRDAVSRRGAHAAIYDAFRKGEVDVLVGTQMVAKGWDVPGVTLVAALAADAALHLPDFRSAERTFQLLVQVAGRAGRGPLGGEVIVQTYDPTHPAVRLAASYDYRGFADGELAQRRQLGYPPYVRLIRWVASAPPAPAAAARPGAGAAAVAEAAAALGVGASVLGPSPAPIARLHGRWRWHLAVKLTGEEEVYALLDEVQPRFARLADGVRLRLAVDVDPVQML